MQESLFMGIWLFLQLFIESIPVSSSGHIFLFECWCMRLIGLRGIIEQQDIWYQLIQFPTIVVVAIYFFNSWFFLLRHISRTWPIVVKLIGMIGLADSITAFFYLLIKHYQLVTIPLWVGFIITGCILCSLYWCPEGKERLTFERAAILGCVQGISLLPGISRLGATFVAARWLGLRSSRAFESAWALEIPLIGAACLKTFILDYHLIAWTQVLSWPGVLGILGGSVGAWFGLKWVDHLIKHQQLAYVAWYMIVPTVLALLC